MTETASAVETANVAKARHAHFELQHTLHLLEQRLDIPTRIDNAVLTKKEQVIKFRRENPTAFNIAVALIAVVTATAATLIVRSLLEDLG